MRPIVRRIERLESYARKQRVAAARSVQGAVSAFQGDGQAGQIELLMSAFGGERTGRPLTPAEAEVRAQFWEQAKRQFPDGWIPPTTTTTSAEIVISQAAIVVLVDVARKHRYSGDQMCRVLRAVKKGREPSEEDRACLQTYTPICAHLAQLAGFSAYAELSACMSRVWEATQ